MRYQLVVATRSETPTLQSADGSLWTLADNPAFAMTAVAGPLIKVYLYFGTFVLLYVYTFVLWFIRALVLYNFIRTDCAFFLYMIR